MEGCVQWNLVYGWSFLPQAGLEPRTAGSVGQHLTHWITQTPTMSLWFGHRQMSEHRLFTGKPWRVKFDFSRSKWPVILNKCWCQQTATTYMIRTLNLNFNPITCLFSINNNLSFHLYFSYTGEGRPQMCVFCISQSVKMKNLIAFCEIDNADRW